MLYAVIVVCGFHASSPAYWHNALQITSFCLLLPWAMFLIIRYAKLQSMVKAGLCTLLTGIFVMTANFAVAFILQDTKRLSAFRPERILFGDEVYNTVIGVILVLTGIVLTVTGIIRQSAKHSADN